MPLCKVCKTETAFIGEVDFNKCCEDRRAPHGRVFPKSDKNIPYFSCGHCGFVFTDYCDTWSSDDFRKFIYNTEYSMADYDQNLAQGIEASGSYAVGKYYAALLEGNQESIRILDFGAGGNPGTMGKALIDHGFNVTSYEPYFCPDATTVTGRYDVITVVEVIEHCHDVAGVAQFLTDHVRENGLIFISTLLHPFPSPKDVLDSWYIAPRNGHISIFTLRALTMLFRIYGLNVVETVFGTFAFKKLPQFANQIFI